MGRASRPADPGRAGEDGGLTPLTPLVRVEGDHLAVLIPVKSVVAYYQPGEAAGTVLPALTERQREVARLIRERIRTRKEMGAVLHIALSTIQKHLDALYAKFRVRGVGAMYALQEILRRVPEV